MLSFIPNSKRLLVVLCMVLVCPAIADESNLSKELASRAEQGDARSQLDLGRMYESGQGVPQNYSEAAKWYRRAAEQRDASARFQLGLLYKNGQGVTKDYWEAAKWFYMSAEQGNLLAQYQLGLLYKNGQGVPKNSVQASMWLDLYLAGAKNDQDAITYRNELEKEMTPAQIAEGQGLAREWKSQHPELER